MCALAVTRPICVLPVMMVQPMQPRPSLCFYDDFDGVLFVGGLIGEIGPTNKLDFFPQPVDADVSSQS